MSTITFTKGYRLICIITDEVRRSGRATKGQHTKNIETADATPSKRGGKGGRSKSTKQEATPPEEDADAIIRCICGYVEEDEDDDRKMVICDSCEAWQHNECMEISENDDELPEQYFCEECRPEEHRELLTKVARGEKPWEERAKQRELEEEERKARRRKGGKRGKKGRASEVKAEITKESSTPTSSPVAKPVATPVARPVATPVTKPTSAVAKPAITPTTKPVATPVTKSATAAITRTATTPAKKVIDATIPATPIVPPPVTPAVSQHPVSSVAEPQMEKRNENGQKRKLPIESEAGAKDSDPQVSEYSIASTAQS